MSLATPVVHYNKSEGKQMLFVIVAALISFWPYMVGYGTTDLEHTILRNALDDNDLINQFLSVSAVSLMVPLFVDWLTDMFEYRKNVADSSNTFVLHDMEKAVLYVGLLSVPAIAFVEYDNLSLLWFCMSRFQIVAVLGTLTTTFSRINNYAWSWWMSILSTTILTIAVNLSLYASLIQSDAIEIIAMTLEAIVLVLMVVSTIHWLHRPNFSKSFSALYVRVGTTGYALIIIILIAIEPKEKLTPTMLIAYNAAFIALELGILYYKMRRTKYERFNDIRGLIESRKQYLRYVAHEIRTPLNSACLGTKLLVDALASIEEKDEFDEELFETTKDVTKTLDIAVGILADLMTFNKIESGMLKLTKSVVPIKSYVYDVVETFAAEARAKGIHVDIGVADGAVELLETDAVVGDKFKLYEVLRNLISNALKFSTRNSMVSVRVGFCPKTVPPPTTPNRFFHSTHSASSTRHGGRNSSNVPGRFVDMIARSLRLPNANASTSRGRNTVGSGGARNTVGSGGARNTGSVNGRTIVSGGGRNTGSVGGRNTGSVGGRLLERFSRSIRIHNNNHAHDVDPPDEDEGDIVGELLVVVTDSGVGISKENQKLLFQEGMQFDPEKLQTGGGSGFGLYISKSIVELHGGTMEVACEGEGKGCSFLYRIPMTRQPDIFRLHAAEMAASMAAGGGSGGAAPVVTTTLVNDDVLAHASAGRTPPSVRNHDPSQKSSNSPASVNLSSMGNKSSMGKSGGGRKGSVVSVLHHHEGGSVEDPLSLSLHSGGSGISRASKRLSRCQKAESLRMARVENLHPQRRNSAGKPSFREGGVPMFSQLKAILSGSESDSNKSKRSCNSAQRQVLSIHTTGLPAHLTGVASGSGSFLDQVRHPFETKDDEYRTGELLLGLQSTLHTCVQQPQPRIAVRTTGTSNRMLPLSAIPSRDASDHESGTNSALPSQKASKSPRGAARVRSPALSVENSVGPHYHCLVVDDSGMSRKMLMKTLKMHGHTCEEAENGQMAVQMVKEKDLTTYDAILMDFVMPVMDGPDATKAIRDLGYTGPIIGCTGNTLDMDLLRFKECGCDRVIGKPFELALFHQFMEELRAYRISIQSKQ